MELFMKLTPEDVSLVQGYINHYGGGEEDSSYMPLDRMSYFLRYWSRNKAPLYQMFGEKFILKKEVCFDRDPDQMEEEMKDAMCYHSSLVGEFRHRFMTRAGELGLNFDDTYELRRFVNDWSILVSNEYTGDPIVIPASATVDGRPLQINRGAKVVKMLGKICKALGFEVSDYHCPHCGYRTFEPIAHCPYCDTVQPIEKSDGYEAFRRAHSLVLNQKKLRGNLCLSIHPLDYITMSDNECGWQSCMQWMEEAGDYRLGTIEMMNSAYCVVAYVESKDDMSLWRSDARWNSKRWRQLLMITPEMLLGNKQYPYESDELQGAAMKWLRELANAGDFRCVENEKRYGPYADEALQIMNQRWNKVGTEEVYVHFWFDYMYCDIYDRRMAFIARNSMNQYEKRIEYNLSGPAVCTNCGEVIYKDYADEVEPSWTTCRSCNNMWRCSCCGDWHYGDPYYAEDSDEPYCHWCYEHELVRCEVCGDRVTRTEEIYVRLLPNADEEHECFNWNYVIDACHYCSISSDFKELFGDITIVPDMFGRDRRVVFVENFSDEGIQSGNLDSCTRDLFRLLRDAGSDEERLALVRKNLY